MLTVIIPTLNADATLADTLDHLRAGARAADIGEIIVADGGSARQPQAKPLEAGFPRVKVITSAPGRGVQLEAGALHAKGDWLLFLHADTLLGEGWADAVQAHVRSSNQAAAFRFALDDEGYKARALEAVVRWRCRLLALPYGDQGLLILRTLYDEVGGFKPVPLMEDVDLIRRIGRKRLVFLDVPAITSASRYRQEGYARRVARNLLCLSLWALGVSPQRIAKIYS